LAVVAVIGVFLYGCSQLTKLDIDMQFLLGDPYTTFQEYATTRRGVHYHSFVAPTEATLCYRGRHDPAPACIYDDKWLLRSQQSRWPQECHDAYYLGFEKDGKIVAPGHYPVPEP
jgi:hypothetical protein